MSSPLVELWSKCVLRGSPKIMIVQWSKVGKKEWSEMLLNLIQTSVSTECFESDNSDGRKAMIAKEEEKSKGALAYLL